jgi:hypothetical protein
MASEERPPLATPSRDVPPCMKMDPITVEGTSHPAKAPLVIRGPLVQMECP